MTTYLTVDQVIMIHDSEKPCALLDRAKLESAVAQPAMGLADGTLFYPTVHEQAAVLLHRICQAHAFEDANKRTAWLACIAFLEANGLTIRQMNQQAVVQLMVAVAMGKLDHRNVAKVFIDLVVVL